MTSEQEVGKHAFVMPDLADVLDSSYYTFSVGVFAWIPLQSGAGVKRGPAKVRVTGLRTSDGYEAVQRAAASVAHALDAGTYTGKKTFQVV